MERSIPTHDSLAAWSYFGHAAVRAAKAQSAGVTSSKPAPKWARADSNSDTYRALIAPSDIERRRYLVSKTGAVYQMNAKKLTGSQRRNTTPSTVSPIR